MIKALTLTYSYGFNREHRLYMTYALFGACALMALMYGINVYSIVSRTIAVERLEVQVGAVDSAVQKLDAQYFALSNKITPDSAKAFGLHESAVEAYIPKTASLGRADNGVPKL